MTADEHGLLRDINGAKYVSLGSTDSAPEGSADTTEDEPELEPTTSQIRVVESDEDGSSASSVGQEIPDPAERRVFITHGKDGTRIIRQLKEILGFGGFEPVVAEERETTAKPVPQKVMGDMRSCSAGVIHVSGERRVLDQDGKEQSDAQ